MPPRGTITGGRYRRLRALNPIIVTDNYVIEELAVRFGVSKDTIINDRVYIMSNWWRMEECEATREERLKQVEFLKMTRRLALESYHRSRQDKEEITTRYDDKLCEDCNGTGKLPLCKCLNCEGTGHVTEEVVQRKISGQAGDASFLAEARRCTEAICKLMGLNKPVEERHHYIVEGNVDHEFIVDEKYEHVDPLLIIEAKAAMARLEEAAAKKTVDGEVMSKEVKDGQVA